MVWKPDYVPLALFKNALRVPADDDTDDALFSIYITTASRSIDDFAGRQFGKTDDAEPRRYESRWDYSRCAYVAVIDDLMTIEGLIVSADGTVLTADDYELEPLNAIEKGRPYERIVTSRRGRLTITPEYWGWTTTPAAVQNAVLLQGARFESRRDAPFGVAGSPSDGSEVRLLAKLDPDVETSLKPYRRRWWAA